MYTRLKRFIERRIIPSKIKQFIKKIDNIEQLSLEELKDSLNDIEHLQDLVTNHKGKISKEEKMNYTPLIVDLRYKLTELYEDREKEEQINKIIGTKTKNLTPEEKELCLYNDSLKNDIEEQTQSIKSIQNRYQRIEKSKKTRKNSYRKLINRVKNIKLRKKYVTVPVNIVNFFRVDNSTKYFFKYQKRKVKSGINKLSTKVEKGTSKVTDSGRNLAKNVGNAGRSIVTSTKQIGNATAKAFNSVSTTIENTGNTVSKSIGEAKSNISKQIELNKKNSIAQSRLNKIKRQEKKKVSAIKRKQRLDSLKRDNKLRLNSLNKKTVTYFNKTSKKLLSGLNLVKEKTKLVLATILLASTKLGKKSLEMLKNVKNNISMSLSNIKLPTFNSNKKTNSFISNIKGELEVAAFKISQETKIGLETIKNHVVTKKVNNKKVNTSIENDKNKMLSELFKVETKEKKTKQKRPIFNAKVKNMYVELRGNVEALLFKLGLSSKEFIGDVKKRFTKTTTSSKKTNNKSLAIRTALAALMLSLGIGGAIAAKKHYDEKNTEKTNNKVTQLEINNDIMNNTEGLKYTLFGSQITEKLPMMDINELGFNFKNNEIEEPEILDDPIEEFEEPEILDDPIEEIEEPEILDDPIEEIEEPEILDDPIEEIEEPEILDDLIEEIEDSEILDAPIEEIEDSQLVDSTDSIEMLSIGEEIRISEGSSLYSNMYDAYFNDNELKQLYSDEDMPRTIKTIIVSNGDEIKNINSNEELSNYLDNNYEIIGCGVSNEFSTSNQIEGFYRIESIKGVSLQKSLM